jgi:hypothetical protein
MGNPFDFAKPVIKFNKLDDLPKKPHTPQEVIAALKVLHKMVHAQADHYGGKHGILLPAQISEESLLSSLMNLKNEADEAKLDAELDLEEAAEDLMDNMDAENIVRFGTLLSLLIKP